MTPNEESTGEIRRRLRESAGLSDKSAIDDVIEQTYRLLAQAPCRIAVASLEDAAMVDERPNMPATTRPANWSIALPVPIDDLMESELPKRIAAHLGRDS
jgi:4-alpha-glucanotransferase